MRSFSMRQFKFKQYYEKVKGEKRGTRQNVFGRLGFCLPRQQSCLVFFSNHLALKGFIGSTGRFIQSQLQSDELLVWLTDARQRLTVASSSGWAAFLLMRSGAVEVESSADIRHSQMTKKENVCL